jgi:hypothetical protein
MSNHSCLSLGDVLIGHLELGIDLEFACPGICDPWQARGIGHLTLVHHDDRNQELV